MAEDKNLGFRIALVGKTGTGKSATGNTIFGKKQVFESKPSSSTITEECQKETGLVDDQSVSVVDTPGLFDTHKSEEAVMMEIFRCISLLSPGPHVFLVVIQAGRFTGEEQETLNLIKQIFGERAAKYTMALFTHGDDLEEDGVSMENFINKSRDLHAFISQCGGGYHVFNNRKKNNPSQVLDLLEKIKEMVKKNGGSYYTNEMLKESERAIREEMERLMSDNPSMKPKEARKKAERNNKFFRRCLKAAGVGGGVGAGLGVGAGVGIEVAIGGGIGAVGGPLGAVAGAAAGVGVGLVVRAAIVAAKKKGCATQ